MGGKSARRKGHQWERDCANFFCEIGFGEACRNVTECQSGDGIDLVNTGRFDVQCKRYKSKGSVINSWLDEIPVSDTNYKLVMAKVDYEEPYVAMPLCDFKELVEIMKAEGIL